MDSKWHALLTYLIGGISIGHFRIRHNCLVLVDCLAMRDGFEVLTVNSAVKFVDYLWEDRLGQAHAHRFFISRGLWNLGCDIHSTHCIDVPGRILHQILGLLHAHSVLAQLLPSKNRP